MNAPKKPMKAVSKRAAVRAVPVAPVVLTRDETELLRCYRTMDQRARSENLVLCQWGAEQYPMVKRIGARPAQAGVRLAAADGKAVRA